MPKEKSKVELKPMVMDQLQYLVVWDILYNHPKISNPIPLPLIRLSEYCISIYERNKKTYNAHRIDYEIKDVEYAINTLRDLEVEKVQYTPKTSETIQGQVTITRYPPVDGNSVILLTRFVDDILSLTEIPRYSIKIKLETGVIGITETGEKGETS